MENNDNNSYDTQIENKPLAIRIDKSLLGKRKI